MLPECTRHQDGLALLQKCKENPRDLAPRLILADWLEDQAEEEMAYWIRTSTSSGLAEIRDCLPDKWHPLTNIHFGWLGCESNNTTELVQSQIFQSNWLTKLDLLIQNDAEDQIGRLVANLADSNLLFLSIDFLPGCHRVKNAINKLANALQLRSLICLDLSGGLGDRELSTLAESPVFRRLEKIRFAGTFKKRWSLRSLARSQMLASVKDFHFSARDLGQIAEIANSPHLRNLNSLELAGAITENGLNELFASPVTVGLKN